MKKLLAILIALPFAISCNWTDYLELILHRREDPAVARVGNDFLFRSEIAKLLPKGISAEDSVRMSASYIESWALSRLLMLEAEEALSKDDKDITKDVAEFRRNLLTFRYEKMFVESRIDTVVSEQEIRGIYESSAEDYTFPYSVIRGRVVKISPKSPYYREIKERFRATAPQDVEDLEKLCNSSAERYVDFSRGWVASSALAREMGTNLKMVEARLSSGTFFECETDAGNFLVFVEERTAPGRISPLEYNIGKIREMIISRRKQGLLASMQKDILDGALADGTFKIYKRNE